MSKLIDTEKLDFVSYQGIPNGYKDSFDSGVLYAMNLIDKQPIIDAVPVVRCKDCIHRRKGGFSRSETDGWTVVFTAPCDLGDEGFCSKGEKVTEDGII